MFIVPVKLAPLSFGNVPSITMVVYSPYVTSIAFIVGVNCSLIIVNTVLLSAMLVWFSSTVILIATVYVSTAKSLSVIDP